MTTTVHDGGPAFSRGGFASPDHQHIDQGDAGMSLRDWFAGQALPLAALNALAKLATGATSVPDDEIAREAYDLADAMLKARQP